jgi:L-ascorbate metabolism protein UlaG (beta-lactamase superfamily)
MLFPACWRVSTIAHKAKALHAAHGNWRSDENMTGARCSWCTLFRLVTVYCLGSASIVHSLAKAKRFLEVALYFVDIGQGVHRSHWDKLGYMHPCTHAPMHPCTHAPMHPCTHAPTCPCTHVPIVQ